MNIKKELNSIIILKKNGLDNKMFDKLSFEDRFLVSKLKKDLSCLDKNIVCMLKEDSTLVEYINKSTISLDNFNSIIKCKEIKDMKSFLENFDNDLYEDVKEVCFNTNDLYNSYFITFSYINLKENKLTLQDIKNISKVFRNLYMSREEFGRKAQSFLIDFSINLGKMVRDFCYTTKCNLSKLYCNFYINNTFNYELLDFCNELFLKAEKNTILNEELIVIAKTINSIQDKDERSKLKDILLRFTENETSCMWIKKLAANDNTLKLEEIEILSKVAITKDTPTNPTDILFNSPILSKLSDMYYDFRDELIDFKIEFIKSNMKKKGFMKLVNENMAEFIQLKSDCIIFNEKFSKIVNLNTLNVKNLNSLYDMNWERIFDDLNESIPLTFNEFEVLYDKCKYTSGNLISKVFYNLLDLKIDTRIKLIKQLPKLKIIDLSLNDKLDFNEGDISLGIANLIKQKSFRDRINELKVNITRVTDNQLLLLFLYEDKIKDYINTIKYGSDIEFLILNYENIDNFGSVVKAKEEYYRTKSSFNFLIDKLEVSEDFVERNKDKIIHFCDKGLQEVFMSLYNAIDRQQQKNLKLLVKAEILGKLKDIKFSDKDFDLEIGLEISKETKNEWKKNIKNEGKFSYEETYDFERIIKLGQYPVQTCQHWHRGMYVECLLSNFDTNKKMLTSSKNGVLNARSLFRLTKGTLDKDNVSLTFLDVEELENENVEKNYNKQELVLFLEKMYTNLDIKEELMVRKEFLKIAKEKANKLGARLVVSEDYKDIMNEFDDFELKDYYLFISYSKNGYQYLDSLTGSCSSKNEGSFEECYAYIQK